MNERPLPPLVPSRTTVTRLFTRRMLAERRRLIAGLTIGGFLLALLTTALYSSLGAEYDALFEEMPAAFASMLGDAELGTIEGWLQAEVFSFMGPGLVIGSAISVGSGGLAGAERGGRLALVSSGPVERSTIVNSVAMTIAITAAVTTGGLVLGILVGALLAGVSISVGNVLAASLLLMLLAVTMGTLALAAGAVTGQRGTSTATAVVVAVASYCVFSFFPLSERLDSFASVSFWHPYAGGRPLTAGLNFAHVFIFAIAIAVAVAVSVIGFERRDLTD
jgi:ABC-2 type transport system permease protein